MTLQQEREFADHRARFAEKRARDRQQARATDQFGPDGPGIPPDPEDPEPTRQVA